jgi:organic hydroperoxide reductase OsmC/OhrA
MEFEEGRMSANQPEAGKTSPSRGEKKSAESHQLAISMDSMGDYEFRVRFDKAFYSDLLMDEPPPLGGDKAPNASRVLAAAVGNCLSASLLFCARKAHVNIQGVHTEVKVNYVRNEQGRLRIGKIDVDIQPRFDPAELQKAQRCLELFEDYCVVTQSVRKGIDVSVAVNTSASTAVE